VITWDQVHTGDYLQVGIPPTHPPPVAAGVGSPTAIEAFGPEHGHGGLRRKSHTSTPPAIAQSKSSSFMGHLRT
jgi:hypothetical protein